MPWVHPSLGAGAGICWGFGVSGVLRERACAGGGGGSAGSFKFGAVGLQGFWS